MITTKKFTALLVLALCVNGLVFLAAFNQFDEWSNTMRHAARWTGRVSLVAYLLAFTLFIREFKSNALFRTQNITMLFCFLHLIHFAFLASNVHLNDIGLVPYKLLGGALAYLMIVFYPFLIHRIKEKTVFHLVYFYYVGFVMAVTIIARLRGDFEGAVPSKFHYFGLGGIMIVFFAGAIGMLRKRKGLFKE